MMCYYLNVHFQGHRVKYTDVANEHATFIIRVRPSTLMIEYQFTWRLITKCVCLHCAKQISLLCDFVSFVYHRILNTSKMFHTNVVDSFYSGGEYQDHSLLGCDTS